MNIEIIKLDHGSDMLTPTRATSGSAGMDLYAAIYEPMKMLPFQRMIVPTGITIAVPIGYEAQIRPRSGLALKHGITVLNSPGTIDSDYRGEIQIILINFGNAEFIISRGDRIAQMVIAEYQQATLVPVKVHDQTVRGDKGFGSTGV